jgi:hypothetical protein
MASGLLLIDVADPMRGQINVAILVFGQLCLAMRLEARVSLVSASCGTWRGGGLPLVESHIVLHKEQHLIREIRWPQCRGQVDVF